MSILAKAQMTDRSGDLGIMLACIFMLVAAALLAAAPIRMARLRKHRFTEAIVAVAVVWACLAAGSGIYTLLAETKYASEHTLLIMTGYFDPHDVSGAPAWPWALWGGLLVAYGVLVGVSAAGKRTPPAKSPPGGPVG